MNNNYWKHIKSNCGLLITEETGIQREKPQAQGENPTNLTNTLVCNIFMEHKSGLGDEPESHTWKTLQFQHCTSPSP